MKYLVWFLAVFLSACVSGGPIRLDTPTAEELTQSSVALVDEDGHAFCSGTILTEGILTAAHCVRDETEVRVGLFSGYVAAPEEDYWSRSFIVPVLKVDRERDLALLGFYAQPTLPLAAENARVGDPILAVGHPMGIAYTVHQGHVSGHVRHGFVRDFMLTDLGLIGGMSGGGVFDQHGHLVGVVSFAFCESPFVCTGTLGGFVPVETVMEFLL